MARQKKDHHAITLRLASPVYDRLTEFCEDSGQTKTTAIERALVMYMDNYYEKQMLIADVENRKKEK